jgi:hypothetical protein
MWPKYRRGDACWLGETKVVVVQSHFKTLGRGEVFYTVLDKINGEEWSHVPEMKLEPRDRGEEDGS